MRCSFVQTQEPHRVKGTRYTLMCLMHGDVGSRFLEHELEALAEAHVQQNTP